MKNMRLLTLLFFGFIYAVQANASDSQVITLEKELLYDQHTLQDNYFYKKIPRKFQWDKIRNSLAFVESIQAEPTVWGILQNNKNKNGKAPLVKNYYINEYNIAADAANIQRYQSVPLYIASDLVNAERYGRDGVPVKIIESGDQFIKAQTVFFPGEWMIPKRYVSKIKNSVVFNHIIFVDKTNQNIATVEKVDSKWLIRSMNPATTGVHRPPYQMETPSGLFVLQEKLQRMYYYRDGTKTIAGFAPFGNRFTNGAYIHGVPLVSPRTEHIEFAATLGTIPRSHMCVRNATSHAEFIYNWAPTKAALVFVFD